MRDSRKTNPRGNTSEVPIDNFTEAIRGLHGCESEWIESVAIKEMFGGNVVWEGVVQVFRLIDHPASNRCYAWSHAIDDSKNRKFIAVRHQGPVDS